MTATNNRNVVLITDDDRLADGLERFRPTRAHWQRGNTAILPKLGNNSDADAEYWIDISNVRAHAPLPSQTAVIFFEDETSIAARTDPAWLIHKSRVPHFAARLWDARVPAPLVGTAGEALPAWLLDLHEIDLRQLCHACIQHLPARMSYREAAVYLFDPQQNVLSLGETNSAHYVDLAVSMVPDSEHLFAAVAHQGSPLLTDNLALSCRLAGYPPCSLNEQRGEQRACLLPLHGNTGLAGLLALNDDNRGVSPFPSVPLGLLSRYLGRCIEHARQYLRTRVEARVDHLTGLFNHRWMLERLGNEISRAGRYGTPLSLIMADLDGLKQINDRYGHLAGDALLRHAARKVQSALRQVDAAARFGGDEFVILLPETDLQGAAHVGERMLAALELDAPVIAEHTIPVRASFGVAQWESGWDENTLIQMADSAMYAAKRQGPNHMVCHPHGKTADAVPLSQHAPARLPVSAD